MNYPLFMLKSKQSLEDLKGPFYVIEAFPYPQFVMNEDGELKCFDTYEDAMIEVNDCQDGYVIMF